MPIAKGNRYTCVKHSTYSQLGDLEPGDLVEIVEVHANALRPHCLVWINGEKEYKQHMYIYNIERDCVPDRRQKIAKLLDERTA